ncbi:MAG: metallophosphoesterase [Thermoanaerobacterales bacterium]|jgi:3',5'-cyclic AMP phosphodiesterase CpdA|nr:metallophosphoesterase [Thermoanaerobacterales bacterium]
MKQIRKISVFVLVFILMLSFCGVFAAADTGSGLGITGPCYAVLSPAGDITQMAVTWWDRSDITEASVQYSTTKGFLETEGAVIFEAAATAKRSAPTNGYTSFEAVMTGLTANTTYYYRVGHDDLWSEEYSFTTADPSATESSFMYMGDIQYATYVSAPEDYQTWGNLLEGAYQAFPELDFVLLGGDMVHRGMDAFNWQLFLSQATRVFSGVPMLAVPGNHESNNSPTGKPELFLDFLAMPTNGPTGFEEEFFSYDYGNCHIVGLNSSIFLNEQLLYGRMTEEDFDRIAAWIADDLADSIATWKVVVMHHPAYPVVSDPTAAAVLENWEPIFTEAQVDLVFCGHQHIYMRTNAIKGVTYVMGNSGSRHYAPAEVPYSEVMIENTSTFQIVNAGQQYLTMTTFDAEGNTLDTVTLAAKDRSLATAKAAAKKELDSYKDPQEYRKAQQAELAAAIQAGKAAIDAATDIDGVERALAGAKAVIDEIKTDAQLTEDEALEAAKTEAKEALESYKDPAKYRKAQQAELAAAIEAGKAAIDAATDIGEVERALADARAAIDKIKTDAQLTAEKEGGEKDTMVPTEVSDKKDTTTDVGVTTGDLFSMEIPLVIFVISLIGVAYLLTRKKHEV